MEQPTQAHVASEPGQVGEVYRELCASIRATDETSLKLLAAVPLATGIGITLLVRAPTQELPNVVRSFLCLFAAVITFAIYRWERKNIAMCGHLRTWALALERDYFKLGVTTTTPTEHPHGHVTAPRLLRLSWGKTQSETLLYRAVVLSWLAASVYTLIR